MIEGLLARRQEAGFEIAEVWSLDMQLCGNTELGNPVAYLYGKYSVAVGRSSCSYVADSVRRQ